MAKQTKQFQTEVKEILDLMINSLYSHKEIFLRELISNSSDALDKLRFESLTNTDLKDLFDSPTIRVQPDAEKKTLTITDNGIGMSYDEVIQNIGTIAHSGSKNFLKKINDAKDNPELIGQFGVGFYSAFMVADKVTLHTQKAGSKEGCLWESGGDGSYQIDKVPRPGGHGTTLTLHLKALDDADSQNDFLSEWVLKSTVKKYSDFIQYPIKMQVTKTEAMKDDKGEVVKDKTQEVIEDETLNSSKALWLQSPKDIKPEEYNEFYQQVANDWQSPLKTIHFKAEGTQEFTALLFVPSQPPFDYFQRERKYGLSLYVQRVFILSDCEELIPSYLRFMKGIVDSSDLSLNVSREFLQKDRQTQQIQKSLTGKILGALKDEMKKNREVYETFWKNFGATLKEGVAGDASNKEKIKDLLLFRTSEKDDQWTSLTEYVDRMKEGQKAIYYLQGDQLEQIKKSPYLECLKEKGYEVILTTDPVDEWVMNSLGPYNKLEVVSITSTDLNLSTESEKKEKEEELKVAGDTFEPLLKKMQEALDLHIKEVKISDRLKESPVCLVSSTQGPSSRMERLMESMGQKFDKTKRTLEVNPKHPLMKKMLELDDISQLNEWSELLYGQALLNEGSPLEDPVKFSQQIAKLMQ